MKRQATPWEKAFASHIAGKELTHRLYKEFLQLKRKTDNLTRKQAKYLKSYFTKDIGVTDRHRQTCPAVLTVEGRLKVKQQWVTTPPLPDGLS